MAEVVTEPVPLVQGTDGVMRVRGTRITLDTVLAACRDGATAEEIVQQYPSISLADVYQVIGYSLRHSSELEAYFAQRRETGRTTRQLNESTWPPDGIRDWLLARDILRALFRRNPTLDIVRAQDVGLSGVDDSSLLAWDGGSNTGPPDSRRFHHHHCVCLRPREKWRPHAGRF